MRTAAAPTLPLEGLPVRRNCKAATHLNSEAHGDLYSCPIACDIPVLSAREPYRLILGALSAQIVDNESFPLQSRKTEKPSNKPREMNPGRQAEDDSEA